MAAQSHNASHVEPHRLGAINFTRTALRRKRIFDSETAEQLVPRAVAGRLHKKKTAVPVIDNHAVTPQHVVDGVGDQRRHVVAWPVAVVGKHGVLKAQHWQGWLAHKEQAELENALETWHGEGLGSGAGPWSCR